MTRIFLLVILFASLPMKRAQKVASTQTCADKWKDWGNSWYLFVAPAGTNCDHEASNWNTAQKYCKERGADLVSLTTNDEVDFVHTHTKSVRYLFWIGLSNSTNGNWTWSNGDKLNILKWNDNEPNFPGTEHCVEILQLKKVWNNQECTDKLAWICEKPKSVAACTSVSCLNGGICLNGTCSCHTGYTGSRCDMDIDECKESPGICQNGANCTNTNGSYTCTCTAAYTGRNCSINIDDCKTDDGSSKCLNNGTCIDGEGKFSCKCQDPYFGPLCAYNECTSLPCHNDGQCVVEDKGYRCKCRAGFTGVNCDTPPDHCLSRPCQNNATCTTIGNTTFNCNCAAGFTGKNCSVNVDDCLFVNCQNNALCRDGINEYKCVCGPGFIAIGSLCQYQDVNECLSLPCLNNGNCINRNGRYVCECPLGFTGKNCEMNYVVSKDPISQLAQKEVNISNVVNITQEVKKLSVSSHPLQARDISNIATILQKIVAVKQKANETFDDFCTTINNVLDASEESVFQSQHDTNSSSRIVKALNDFLETLVIDSSGKFKKVERNYAALVQAVQPQTFSGLTFSGRIVRKSNILVLTESNNSVPQVSSSSISIPGTIFNESTITNSSRQQRIIFVLYKKTSFFKVSLEDTKKTSSRLNSFVIAGSIKGLSVRNLSNPVEITLQQSVARGDTNSALCSYWNFTLGNWSQEGCMFKRVLSDGRILCNCNHLTNFAMLMDFKPAATTKHERILGVISIVGCALSLVGLTLTIITILIVRELRSKLPTKILLNYCIALSLTLIVFLATPEGSKSSSLARCRTAAVALHYFLLAAFLWMAVEAFSLYLAIIKSRKIDLYPCVFLLKCCLFAWGTPAIIVAITMIVALDKYGDEGYCRLHGVPFFVAFVTPVILILAGNIVVFCLVIRSLLTSGKKVTSSLKVSSFQQARQGIAIMVLLGLTWVFGFLAIDDVKLAFQWLFCIFNSLQGFLVFILFCILPAGTRKHLRKLCSKKSSYQIREDPSTGSTAIGKMCSVNDQCSASGDELKTLDDESNC